MEVKGQEEKWEQDCITILNKLIDVLFIGIPRIRNMSQIDPSYFVEIYCHLMHLDFSDYTPDPERPWKDIQDLILSLKDRLGSHNFDHLNPILIAGHNPKHTLCLCQILNAIYEYYKGKGRSFTTPRPNFNSTELDNSRDKTKELTDNSSSDSEFSSALPHRNKSESSSGTLEEHKFEIPFTDSELDVDVLDVLERSATGNDSDFEPPSSAGYLAETEEIPEEKSQTRQKRTNLQNKYSKSEAEMYERFIFGDLISKEMMEKRRALFPHQKSVDIIKSKHFGIPSPSNQREKPSSFSQMEPSSSSGMRRALFPQHNSLDIIDAQLSAIPSKYTMSQKVSDGPGPSNQRARPISSSQIQRSSAMKYHSSSQKKPSASPAKPNSSFAKKPSSSSATSPHGRTIATGFITEKKSKLDKSETFTHVGVINPRDGERELDASDLIPTDAMMQMYLIQDEVQKLVRSKLNEVEHNLVSFYQERMKPSSYCCGGHKTNVPSAKPKRPAKVIRKAPCPPPPKHKPRVQKFDFFGNPIKERFPENRGGLIRTVCNPLSLRPKKFQPKARWKNVNELLESEDESNCPHRERGTDLFSCSSSVCCKILKEVLQVFPNCDLDEETFQTLKKKCKKHCEVVTKQVLDEQNIRNVVNEKLKNFVECNKATISLQKKQDEAEGRRREILLNQQLSKMHENRIKAEKAAKHEFQKEKYSAQRQIKKLCEAKKVESRQIIETFDIALQHEKKLALQTRKEKVEQSKKVTAETDKLLKNLQEFYTKELKNLREEYAKMRHDMGPYAVRKYNEIQRKCRQRIQRELDKCVDKIIQNLDTISDN